MELRKNVSKRNIPTKKERKKEIGRVDLFFLIFVLMKHWTTVTF